MQLKQPLVPGRVVHAKHVVLGKLWCSLTVVRYWF